jgi:hypothetical protein
MSATLQEKLTALREETHIRDATYSNLKATEASIKETIREVNRLRKAISEQHTQAVRTARSLRNDHFANIRTRVMDLRRARKSHLITKLDFFDNDSYIWALDSNQVVNWALLLLRASSTSKYGNATVAYYLGAQDQRFFDRVQSLNIMPDPMTASQIYGLDKGTLTPLLTYQPVEVSHESDRSSGKPRLLLTMRAYERQLFEDVPQLTPDELEEVVRYQDVNNRIDYREQEMR